MNIFFKKFAVQIFVVLFILFVLLIISSIAPFSAVGTQAVLNKKDRYWLQPTYQPYPKNNIQPYPKNNILRPSQCLCLSQYLKMDKLTGEIFQIKPCDYNEKLLCAYRVLEIQN